MPPARKPDNTYPRLSPIGTPRAARPAWKSTVNRRARCVADPMNEKSGASGARLPKTPHSRAMTKTESSRTCCHRAPFILLVFECRKMTNTQRSRRPDSVLNRKSRRVRKSKSPGRSAASKPKHTSAAISIQPHMRNNAVSARANTGGTGAWLPPGSGEGGREICNFTHRK